MSSFSNEGGSAVSEFVMVVVPVTLIIITLQSFFGVVFSALMIKQGIYDATRYAALADVTIADAQSYGESKVPGISFKKTADYASCMVIGTKTELFQISNYLPELEITLKAVSTCELP